ncbi:MAG: hypothetical protein Q4B87_02605 [Candidatus Saccharibacteria bacterium]|nr:hypothetical protein [Candidatus Saccharibacteria bacterium]
MQKETETNVMQREKLKKKFFDERGHVRNRERFIKSLEGFYGDKIDLDFVSEAEMIVALGLADYLKREFFEELAEIAGKPFPSSMKGLVELVECCIEKERRESNISIHADILDCFSFGAKLCACMESGIIGMDTSLKLLRRAETFALEEAEKRKSYL